MSILDSKHVPELNKFTTGQMLDEIFHRMGKEDSYRNCETSLTILDELVGQQSEDRPIELIEAARDWFDDYLENYDGAPEHCYDYVSTTVTDLAATFPLPR